LSPSAVQDANKHVGEELAKLYQQYFELLQTAHKIWAMAVRKLFADHPDLKGFRFRQIPFGGGGHAYCQLDEPAIWLAEDGEDPDAHTPGWPQGYWNPWRDVDTQEDQEELEASRRWAVRSALLEVLMPLWGGHFYESTFPSTGETGYITTVTKDLIDFTPVPSKKRS
jgi:hypothetical protein